MLSKVKFLRDTGLLCDPLSILEVVQLHILGDVSHKGGADKDSSGREDKFSYESFYGWLRSIASLIYPQANDRKSLHLLLTEVFRE